jgi:hypothetical protein
MKPQRDRQKYRYTPGCIACQQQTSSKFHLLTWKSLDLLEEVGVKAMFGAHASNPWLCGACLTVFYHYGIKLLSVEENKNASQTDDSIAVILVSDMENPGLGPEVRIAANNKNISTSETLQGPSMDTY